MFYTGFPLPLISNTRYCSTTAPDLKNSKGTSSYISLPLNAQSSLRCLFPPSREPVCGSPRSSRKNCHGPTPCLCIVGPSTWNDLPQSVVRFLSGSHKIYDPSTALN